MDAIIYSVIGFVLGALVMFFYTKKRGAALDSHMENQFKITAQEAMHEAVKKAHETFLPLAEARLKDAQKDGAHDLDKRQRAIDEMVKPVHKNLEALGKALEQSQGTDQAMREDLKHLNKETAKLAGALRNPAARGNWGEEMLERLLENSGLIKDVHYSLQKTFSGDSGRLRPDAVINLPDSLHIVIDAKAPINDFVRNLDEDLDERSYKELQQGLAQAVRTHVQELSKKAYWEQLNSPDFVVLFLPSEHLFSAAIQADASLLDLAAKKNIVLASPILTMSLIRVVGMSWRQVDLAKNAQDISALGAELYERISVFSTHMEKVGRGLGGAMDSYNKAIGSLETRVLSSARKFEQLSAAPHGKTIEQLEQVEHNIRPLSAPSEEEADKKRA